MEYYKMYKKSLQATKLVKKKSKESFYEWILLLNFHISDLNWAVSKRFIVTSNLIEKNELRLKIFCMRFYPVKKQHIIYSL